MTKLDDQLDQSVGEPEQPKSGYLDDEKIELGLKALKDYVKNSKALKLSQDQRKSLLEAGEKDTTNLSQVYVDVVFKNIPSNSKTYIHNVIMPHHWRLKSEPVDDNIAIFVRHLKPENEAQKIQFARDRDLDIEHTHDYYKRLFEEKLDESIHSRISRIITTKELATEYPTFQKLDRLAKTYDLFLSDQQLMANKMNSLPRRLGRRFWVREKKVPLMVKLDAKNLQERFHKVLSTEPFYVLGRSATERIQVGVLNQSTNDLAENIRSFLKKLYDNYGDNIRFLKLRTNWGIALPLFADLTTMCPRVVMKKRKIKPKPVVDDFDMLESDARVAVHSDGSVRIMNQEKRKASHVEDESPAKKKPLKKMKKEKSVEWV